MNQTFTLTEEHIKLLKNSYTCWFDAEYGSAAIDPKRPYGNSSVDEDIAEILGIKGTEDSYGEIDFSDADISRIRKVHSETETALQIVLNTLSFVPGEYVSEMYGEWKLKK